jgi:N-acetylmuramoyl-L-alanine amidase
MLVVHCSATPPTMDIGKREIDTWHRQRGWLKIGYHYVIKRDGTLEEGRDRDVIGAHAKGHNSKSLGICLVGGVNDENEPENNFTKEQFSCLTELLLSLSVIYPDTQIVGHNTLDQGKACPSFNVEEWWSKSPNS